MAKHQCGLLLFFSILVSLSLVSFVSCILAESKKAKKEDLKLSNKLCELPQSHAFGFGIAALTWLVIAQVVGNVMICAHFRHTENSKAMKPKIATGLLVFSWVSFGIAAVLLSTATSMSRRQAYGKGWLDHECYVVKDGVFIGSGVLILVTTAALLGSAIFTQRGGRSTTR
ncbi:hypothetical protein OIU74_011921 [Salix koriyanagi]|uniref:Uncharacterized protein n=1 Tax=Salix koriyanagi TaxID=2511006 RepID=A0A9Q0Q5J1_9ROSI|nr:hypothetical protein OIU74_011921 [Salix koriyanagi]